MICRHQNPLLSFHQKQWLAEERRYQLESLFSSRDELIQASGYRLAGTLHHGVDPIPSDSPARRKSVLMPKIVLALREKVADLPGHAIVHLGAVQDGNHEIALLQGLQIGPEDLLRRGACQGQISWGQMISIFSRCFPESRKLPPQAISASEKRGPER